jgi:hypothetical protein
MVFDRSNFYTALGSLLRDDMAFGTSAMVILDDPDNYIRCQVFPIGSFAIAMDDKERADRLCREHSFTVRQLAQKFGEDALPLQFRETLKKGGRTEHRVEVKHMIGPNPLHDPNALYGYLRHPWVEMYWVKQAPGLSHEEPNWGSATSPLGMENAGVLGMAGFHEFPCVVSRWGRNPDDAYGTSAPGIDALPDIKMLQTMYRKTLNAIEKMVDPPLIGSEAFKAKATSLLKGAVNIDPNMGGQNSPGLRPLYETRFPVQELEASAEQLRDRIRRTFYEHLFLMLLGDERQQRATATEIAAREREKLAVLGPILERKADDVFDPAISRTMAMLIRRSEFAWSIGQDGILPMPPEELAGAELQPVYVSEVAMAARSVGLGSLERHLTFTGNMATMVPAALDIIDIDESVRYHADVLNVPNRLTRPPPEVDAIRRARAEAQQAAAMRENAAQMASAAKDLGETDVDAAQDAAAQLSGV